jgi:ABC-type polysaccharide/polyol phosphate export permease
MSGVTNHAIFHLRLIAQALIKLVHRSVLILGVCLVFNVAPTKQLLLLIPAVLLLIFHSVWVSVVFSLFAARFRDVAEVTELAMRIGFLATPVIWMPTDGVRGSIVGHYLLFNPFYHVLEPVRSAILDTAFPIQSLWISGALALFGLATASLVYARYRRKAIWWV